MSKANHFLPIGILVVVALGAALVSFLGVRTASLESQVKLLNSQLVQKSNQLQAYRQTYCSSEFKFTKEDTTTRHVIKVDDIDRSYRVHTPKNYDPTIRYPVIVNFDGIHGSGSRMEKYSNIDSLPVIAVFPDSLKSPTGYTAWQGAPYSRSGEGDVRFTKALLEELPSLYCADSARTFAVGMSNGGGFAMLAACALPDTFKAVASLSGAYYKSCDTSETKTSLLVVHSTADNNVPFNGSPKRKLPKIVNWVDKQAKNHECKASAKNFDSEDGRINTWYDCKDSVIIRLVVVNNQSHGWLRVPTKDAVPKKANAAEYIWRYFQDVS